MSRSTPELVTATSVTLLWKTAHNSVQALVGPQFENLLKQIRCEEDGMPPMAVIKRKNDPSRLQLCRKRDNGFGIDQRLVHEKNSSALRFPRGEPLSRPEPTYSFPARNPD